MRVNRNSETSSQQLGRASSSSRGAEARSSSLSRADPAQTAPSFSASLRGYVEMVKSVAEMDLQAVREATDLLESGQLDTPDAARRAATAILQRGF